MGKQFEDAMESMQESVDIVISLPGKTWQEKKAMVIDWISRHGNSSFGEFFGWFEKSDIEDM